jgi:impB/mucB/samB family C-terminal domain
VNRVVDLVCHIASQLSAAHFEQLQLLLLIFIHSCALSPCLLRSLPLPLSLRLSHPLSPTHFSVSFFSLCLLSIPTAVLNFITALPTRKVGGVGKVLEKILFAFGLETMGDVREQLAVMMYAFAPATAEFLLFSTHGISQGEGKCDNENGKNENSGECSEDIGRKSLGAERTFSLCCESPEEQKNKLKELCYKVGEKLKEKNLWGKTVTLKVKTVKFELFTRSATNKNYFQNGEIIEKLSFKLLETLFPLKVRLIGVTISKFKNEQNTTSSTSSPQRSLSNFFKSTKSPKNILVDKNYDGSNDDDDNDNSNICGNTDRGRNDNADNDNNNADNGNNNSNSNGICDISSNNTNNIDVSKKNKSRKQDITSVRAHSTYGHVDLFDPNDSCHGDEELEENSELEIGETELTVILPTDVCDDIETNDNNYDYDDDGAEDHSFDNYNGNNNNRKNHYNSKNNNISMSEIIRTTSNGHNIDSNNGSNNNSNKNSNNSNNNKDNDKDNDEDEDEGSCTDMSNECEIVAPKTIDSHRYTFSKKSIQHTNISSITNDSTTNAPTSSLSSSLSSCPALTQKHHHPCPVCSKIVPGTIFALNLHIDKCLLVGSEISRCSQNHRNSSFFADNNSPEKGQYNINKGGREGEVFSSFSTSLNDSRSAVQGNSRRMKNSTAEDNNTKKNKIFTDSSQFTKTKKLKNNFDSRECNIGQENGNKITNFLFHLGRK